MKRILVILAVLVASVSGVKAQREGWYAAGALGLWYDHEVKNTSFTLAPEVGYNFGDEWAIGVKMGIYTRSKPSQTNITLGAYGRYSFLRMERVSLFVDGGVDFSLADASGCEIGFKPGLAVHLSDHFNLLTSFGFLGYRSGFFGDGVGFSFRSSDLRFGLQYCF